jgi:hypothetical protein
LDVAQSAACIVKAEELKMNQCVSMVSVSGDASLNSTCSLVTAARDSIKKVKKSAVGVMVSKKIEAENTASFIMVAGNVEGNVKTVFDWRSALAFGAAFGGVFGLMKLLSRR